MTWENGPTLAQLAAEERRQRRTYPRNKVTFGIGAFGIPSATTILVAGLLLVLVRRQWIHIVVIAAVSGLTTSLILLTLIPFAPEHTLTYLGVSFAAMVAAGLGRLAAKTMVRVAQ
jgi:hypothetical protein